MSVSNSTLFTRTSSGKNLVIWIENIHLIFTVLPLKHTTHTQPTSTQSALTTLNAISSMAITEMNYKKENDNLYVKQKALQLIKKTTKQ